MYMSWGMSPDDFWHGSPELLSAYRKKAELERELKNEQAWWQGMYIYDALMAVKAQFLAKNEHEAKKYTYTTEPYRIKPYTEEELKKKQEEEAQKARDHAIAQFNLMKAAWDSKHGGNH